MEREYRLRPTSRDTAEVEPIVLTPPDEADSGLTRRVLKPLVLDNKRNAALPLKAWVVHQRRRRKDQKWDDGDFVDLRTLRGDQQVRIELDSRELRRLYESLRDLYAVGEAGVPEDQRVLAVVDTDQAAVITGEERDILRHLMEREGPDLWQVLDDLRPDLSRVAALARIQKDREDAVETFEHELARDKWDEDAWERFFRENDWIFGQGLIYQYVREVEKQPDLGGKTVAGTGGVRGDYLLATQARLRFTVLVEIKKPGARLVGKLYRERAHEIGREVAGGVVQVQAQCQRLEREAIRPENIDHLESQGIFTCQPRGLLVIGNLAQLDNRDKRTSFETFRRSVQNPQIVTYDELLERARIVVGRQPK